MRETNPVEVTFLGWMAVAGGLLIVISLCAAYLRRLSISASALYLGLGVALSPLGLRWLHLDIARGSQWFEYLAQVAVIVSLFIGGLKLRLPFSAAAWRTVPWLAGPIMLVSIVGVTCFAYFILHLDGASSLLLGAVLAPTDPVLASSVSVNEAADHDRMRYGLSGEAGLNDGMAFPFVVFAVEWSLQRGPGGWIATWTIVHVLWATPVALVLGYALGRYIGRAAVMLRIRHGEIAGPSDMLALALIAISYVAAESIQAWGFLSVFAAGVGLRRAESAIVASSPHPDANAGRADGRGSHPPAEDLVAAKVRAEAVAQPAVAVGAIVAETLAFGRTAERLLELTLVVLVGAALASHWDVRAVPVAAFLFAALRPLSAHLFLARTPTTSTQRWLMGWFGVRGIGSLYYVAYALTHVPAQQASTDVTNIAVSVVALSIVVHGLTAQPLLDLYERSLSKRRSRRSPKPTSDRPRSDLSERAKA